MAPAVPLDGHSSPWAAHVFASNYKLHTGALALCALAHVVIVLNVPEAATQHTLGFIATLPLLAGRVALHRHAKPADAQRWASTGWCLSIIVVYMASVLDTAKASEAADRATADPLFGMAIFAICALVGMMHASVSPPRPHSIAVLSVVIATITVVVAQARSRAIIAYGAGLLVSHVSGYLLSAHCFEQQAAIVRCNHAQAGIERRNAQLVAEKQRLEWEVVSHHGGGPRQALGAAPPDGEPLAQYLVLGVLQPQEVTDELVSMAVSADHDSDGSADHDSSDDSADHDSDDKPPSGPLFARQLPMVEPVPHLSPGSTRSASVTSSLLRNTPSLVPSSVMDTRSVAAAKDITRSPCMPKDDTMLPRARLKTRSDPGA